MTELTIDQALQQGIEAHKAGQVQEADRLYTAILKAQPKHPDANHNMGVLAVGVGKVEQALPLFKTALEANPATAQFWLSYIDTLIKLEKFADAKAVLDQARSKGAKGDGFDKLEQHLQGANKEPLEANKIAAEVPPPQPNILDSLKLDQAIKLAKKKSKEGAPGEAKRVYKDILTKFPKNKRASDGMKGLMGRPVGKATQAQDPPQDQIQSLINLYHKGEFSLVVENAQVLGQQYPEAITIWNLIGASQAQLGQLNQAVSAFNRVIDIRPDHADAYNNLGNVLKNQGKLGASIRAYNKAIAINPNHASAFNNMGVALQKQGKLQDAVKAHQKAVDIKPDYTDAYNNLAVALQELGKLEEAIAEYTKLLKLQPYYPSARHNLAALKGETTEKAPKEYVENLFDKFADSFEKTLTLDLEYDMPTSIVEALFKTSPTHLQGAVLDLGCGTGLVGEKARMYCDYLEGIDIADGMLKQARLKNIYDKLSHIEIIEYLTNEKLKFDYFISADVFVYMGDLREVFHLIKVRNSKPCELAFSTEHTEIDGFHLLQTGRYAHSKSYIEALCSELKITISHFSTLKLRKEQGKFLTGGLYVLKF